ncbi:MAG: polyribonucleotide nucleotidyltransferase [Chloroflexi bacterium]|nr:polyribonucleotide nucleotidyltransferase [Chloroflexota bacterium]|tara:strand:- start:22521 stop:24614 length:2094 start_codon:yes stop_codon:yes gene_type:complete
MGLEEVSISINNKTLKFENGKLAKQANGSVTIQYGDNIILSTAAMSDPREGIDFFPLSVEFEERMYARGKIPGSFFKREGRPSTPAILIARMTDRSIRPLFPKGFNNEVQVISTTLSSDQSNTFDVMSIIGASVALSISDIPFEGPISATRIGYNNNQFIINPTYDEMNESELDLLIAGSKSGVVMIECGSNEVDEEIVLEAVKLAQKTNNEIINLQEEFIKKIGKSKIDFNTEKHPEELKDTIESKISKDVNNLLTSSLGKIEQEEGLNKLKNSLKEDLAEEYEENHINEVFEIILENEFKSIVLSGGNRPDGRTATEIRQLSSEISLLPRTHGSGLFTRGETQVLSVATLGSLGDAQRLDTLNPEDQKRFMLHYNFPPYSVGETGRVGSPGRREIGHGALAEKALAPVIPNDKDFPYTIRLVAECLGSNGSTSMATVCSGTLALMDAGIPIKTPIAGISIGLITNDKDDYLTITDIQGLEDHIGDMDFKVAGSNNGITAIQLDIKVKSITFEMIKDALYQAKDARLQILELINQTIENPREELSPYAPRITKINIPKDKIGIVIGPGGKTIRGIVEQTEATVDIDDDGTISIGSSDAQAAEAAINIIKGLTKDVEVGDKYTGKVVKITNFGAFIEILPGKDGLVHISELAHYHVKEVEDEIKLGEQVEVLVKAIDNMGRINLSRKALIDNSDTES